MTSPTETKSPRRGATARFLAAVALALGASAWIGACASTETEAFSDGACVAGGCAHGTTTTTSASSSTGGPCTVNTGCSVHWATDIFANILDTQATGCTSTSGLCHGDGHGSLTLAPGDAHTAYTTLMGYTLASSPGPAKKYIVPCDQGDSGMLCNMKADTGSTNPHGSCGSLMPLVGTNLTMDQLNTIADWIACGAPEN